MTGNNVRLVTAADRKLFEALTDARILDRQQASEITGRASVSVSTCNAWLLKLVRAGLLRRFFIATEAGGVKALYCLTPTSAQLSGVPFRPLRRKTDSVQLSDPFLLHQLAVNWILIQVRYRPLPLPDISFVRWRSFPAILSSAVPLIPDGYFELRSLDQIHPMFCEIDLGTESQKVWTAKTKLYLRIAASGEFQQLFHQSRFRILVVTGSEKRLLQIRKTIAHETDKIFWLSTIQAINQSGLFASHWLRPLGLQRLPLL